MSTFTHLLSLFVCTLVLMSSVSSAQLRPAPVAAIHSAKASKLSPLQNSQHLLTLPSPVRVHLNSNSRSIRNLESTTATKISSLKPVLRLESDSSEGRGLSRNRGETRARDGDENGPRTTADWAPSSTSSFLGVVGTENPAFVERCRECCKNSGCANCVVHLTTRGTSNSGCNSGSQLGRANAPLKCFFSICGGALPGAGGRCCTPGN